MGCGSSTLRSRHLASAGAPSYEPGKKEAKNALPLGTGHARRTERPVPPITAQAPPQDSEGSVARQPADEKTEPGGSPRTVEKPVVPLAMQAPAEDFESSSTGHREVDRSVPQGSPRAEHESRVVKHPSAKDSAGSSADNECDAEDSRQRAQETLAGLLKEVPSLPHSLSLGQPEEVAQTLAKVHTALHLPAIFSEDDMQKLLGAFFEAAKRCAGDAAMRARLVSIQQCTHRLLLVTKRLEDGGDLSDAKAQWKKAADKLRRRCASRFRATTQSFGGTALLELYLSQVQLTLVHLPAQELSASLASAAAKVTIGAVKAALVGSYGTLLTGVGEAVGAGLDAMAQGLSRDCFEQLTSISQVNRKDPNLGRWLLEKQREHFNVGEDGRWEPTEGRWEPKAAYAAMLADVVAARPQPLTHQLLRSICLGGDGFIGLTNLMALGAHSSRELSGAHGALVRLTVWAQEVVLRGLLERGEAEEGGAVDPSKETPQAPEIGAPGDEQQASGEAEQQPTNDPNRLKENDGLQENDGLEVLAEELERLMREGQAGLAASAKQLTVAAAKGIPGRAEDALAQNRGGAKGVRAAAAGCQSLAELASKLLRALAASLDETTIAEAAVRCALRELDALLGGLEERLRARLTEVLRKEEFASGLHLVFSTRGQAAEAAAGAPPPPDRSSATQPAASGCGDGSGLRDAARDSIVWLLSRVVLAELEPLRVGLRALDAFLGLSGARESAEEVTPAARLSELARLSMDLEREVSDVVRSEAEKHVGTDAAPLEQHQVEELVERLRASLPAVVGAGVAKSAGLAKSIAEKICADAVQMSAEALAGDRSEVPSVLQSGEVRLHVFVAHVDASVALLQRVSAGTAACEELLSARVQVPLRGVHARLSGEGPADAGAGTTWLPSFMQSRKKPPQGNGDEKAEALVARAWGGLAEALRGLDWALCKITGMEPASNRTEVGEDATCTAPLIMQAAGMREPHAGVPEQGTARAGTGLEQNNLPAALLQLSMHLVQAQALAGSLRAAARRGGLALTELAAGRRTGDVVKESLETAAKESLAAVRGCVQNVVKEMTVAAQEQLDCVAERCTAEVGEAAAGALGDTCGALVAPALGLLGELVKGRMRCHASAAWQVREVAVVSALRVLDSLRVDAGDSVNADAVSACRAVRKGLQSEVLVRFSCERAPSVRALQRDGGALASELNAPFRRSACCTAIRGSQGGASLASATGAECMLGDLHQAMEGERVRREAERLEEAKRREAERLEEAERHAAWAHAQHRVRQSVEAQLRELEEAQRAAEREPDLLKKQLLLVQCRDMHAALAQSSRNVEDIGVALGVVVGFLTTVNAKLDAVNESLNELQSSVRELGADMRRMVGRPVLEELAEQRDKRLLQCQELRREVYIATDGVGPGDDGKFLVSESNKAEDLLEAVKTKLLKSEEVSLLLVSGPAGSGKSTFVSHLEMYLEMEYLEQTRGERGELVLVKVSLPTLKNPMADLFHEALARGYGLREAQIHELRNLARAGTVRLIFLLDAYDELPAQCLFKNLYMSNNLEQYRAQLDGDATPAYPKVIITTRTELLSRDPEYARAFVPTEMNHVSRASVEDARAAFLELRIAPFDSKLDRYIHAKVALEMRRELERHVGTLAALSKGAAGELQKKAESVLDSAQASSDTKTMLEAACAAVTAPRGDKEPLKRVGRYMDQVPMRTTPTVFRVVWALAGALAEVPSGLQQALAEFCDRLARAETGKIWLHQDYREAFNAIPELTELTTTPFMVEIVTEILPKLQETRSTDASIKAKLLLLLSEDAAQMVWGCIGRWRGADDSILKQAQAGLEDKPSQAPAPGAGSGVTGLAEEVVRVLKGQGLLLKQDKLVKIGWEQLQAMGRVSAQGTTKGQAGGVDAGMADGPLTDLLTVLGGDAEVDELLREMVGELEEEESRLLEAISQTGIPYLLKSALQRPRVRRSQIYAMFVVMYVRREASKSLTRGTHEAGAVEQEGAQYAQRLALTMVAENMTKVPLGSGSKLFHEKSVWDPFLRDGGELRVAAQKAAPVRCDGGVLTFIHKTVQEYLCAASLRANLHHILRDLAAPLEELDEELQPEGKPEADTESARRQAGAGTGTERSKDGGAPELHGEGPPQAAVQQTEQVQRRRARAARALGRAEERLMQSEWAQVDLRDEDVVRDFLADLFLDDLEFREEVCFVVAWSERRCAGGCKAGGGGLACGLLLANVRALLGGALPKRSAGTLLHAAAADGSHFAVSKLLDMRRRGILDSVLIEGRDDEGRTPLFCAAQSGHAQVAAALLAAGARRDARSNLRPEDAGVDRAGHDKRHRAS
ncbi:hypothetical protein CYMTET_41503 [Cymbomonas tetramitiformis]|uniref:NACHT domain-containing protein n=1 Tax=Cymbomonas tetramitiformis TaxID=36881 RepID=A0AAE0C701_9CHLO|nr:hypothetical protein CYMTET_41503 [Cymbomonas tetramitiformis]